MWHVLLFLLFLPNAAEAGPVVAAVSYLASAAVTAYSTSLFFATFVNTVALSFASRLLAPDVKGLDNNLTGYDVAGLSPAADHAVIYGETKVGGAIVYKLSLIHI
jgi:hypothetical protein